MDLLPDRRNLGVALRPATDEQLIRSAVLEYGLLEADWPTWLTEMRQPHWLHFGINLNLSSVGCISLEKIGDTARFHVSVERKKIHPNYLAYLLCKIAEYLYQNGFERMEAVIPEGRRASAKLAIRCGMKCRRISSEGRHYDILKSEYYAKET